MCQHGEGAPQHIWAVTSDCVFVCVCVGGGGGCRWKPAHSVTPCRASFTCVVWSRAHTASHRRPGKWIRRLIFYSWFFWLIRSSSLIYFKPLIAFCLATRSSARLCRRRPRSRRALSAPTSNPHPPPPPPLPPPPPSLRPALLPFRPPATLTVPSASSSPSLQPPLHYSPPPTPT